jgi:hypothetical protein
MWQAIMPHIYFDSVFGCNTEVTFDPSAAGYTGPSERSFEAPVIYPAVVSS